MSSHPVKDQYDRGFEQRAERELVENFVTTWRSLQTNGHPRTRKLLMLVMTALGAHIYENRRAHLTPTEETRGRTSRDYAVLIDAEHDGVFLTSHQRPSGRWPREARSASPSGHRGQRGRL